MRVRLKPRHRVPLTKKVNKMKYEYVEWSTLRLVDWETRRLGEKDTGTLGESKACRQSIGQQDTGRQGETGRLGDRMTRRLGDQMNEESGRLKD